MKIVGFGAVSVCGRGRVCHEQAVQRCERMPDGSRGPGPLICRVSVETLSDRAVLGKMRRADRFSKMAVLAAHDAWLDAGGRAAEEDAPVGVVLTTALGPHDTTFKFLDDILDYGDSAVSPTRFSHSVHNTAASYVTTAIGIRGPTTTLTGFQAPFSEGLALTEAWLAAGICTRVLVGYVEELSPAMEYVALALHDRGDGALLQQFNLSTGLDPAFTEGAVFVVAVGGGAPVGEARDLASLCSLLEHVRT